MSYDWTMFFDEFAGGLNPTFKKELSSQLLAKGDLTGIKNFKKYNFQLIVGAKPLDIKTNKNKAFATIEFITPTSWSFPTRISWSAKKENISIELLHTKKVNKDLIDFNWEKDFPLQEVKKHLSPYKKTKGEKNSLGFDVEYFYILIPDIELEIYTEKELTSEVKEKISNYLQSILTNWNRSKKEKEIEFISDITTEDNHYLITMDIGLNNSIKTVNFFLQKLSDKFEKEIIKIKVK